MFSQHPSQLVCLLDHRFSRSKPGPSFGSRRSICSMLLTANNMTGLDTPTEHRSNCFEPDVSNRESSRLGHRSHDPLCFLGNYGIPHQTFRTIRYVRYDIVRLKIVQKNLATWCICNLEFFKHASNTVHVDTGSRSVRSDHQVAD